MLGKKDLIQFRNDLGDAFSFSALNPSGHYSLNLSDKMHQELAKCLFYINKTNYERILKAESVDKSQSGNKSCFRNERVNKGDCKWTPGFVLP